MKNKLLTKSKFLTGLQCPKYLWTFMNEPETIPEPDKITKHRFMEGYLIDDLAKKLYPSGINIKTDDFIKNIKDTQEYLKLRKPLFEAGFMTNNLFARADILNPVKDGKWELIEIKSSTEVKDVHLYDVSFQKHCYEKAGIKIKGCFLIYVNNKYVKDGKIDPSGLFIIEDITREVEQNLIGINDQIKNIFDIFSKPNCPDIDIGEHCTNPYECPLTCVCWDHLPESNIFNLYRGGQKAWELYKSGIMQIKNIPVTTMLTEKQQIQVKCAKTGKTYIYKEGIRDFLNTLKYPLYFLDFETFSTVIPLFDYVRPYQNVPFQFSLHILDSLDIKPIHHSFLASSMNDPRKDFISSLQNLLGDTGSIIVYNKAFEKTILTQFALTCPEYSNWVESVINRFIDLLQPFRSFHYYNPAQHGSASLKAVLPAITGAGYEGLAISDGITASLQFLYMTFGELYSQSTSEQEKKIIRENLEKYCGLDTEGMIWILRKLENICR